MTDLLSRKEIVEYLRKENYDDEIIGIIDNFPPVVLLDAATEREPIAWRIRVRERGGTTYHVYTERLPFEPDADSGIIAIGKAVPVFALDDIHWNEARSAVTQQFEKTLEYLGKTEKE